MLHAYDTPTFYEECAEMNLDEAIYHVRQAITDLRSARRNLDAASVINCEPRMDASEQSDVVRDLIEELEGML